MIIKGDFHIHSSSSYDARTATGMILATALRRGLGAVAVADHNNLDGSLRAVELAGSRPFADFMEAHYPGTPLLLVIPAQEINTRDGELMGLFLTRPLTRGLSLPETAAEIREQGGLVNVPHPFSRIAHRRPRAEVLEHYAGFIDAVEIFNSRSFSRADDQRARAFARRFNLGCTGGSDAHLRNEIGRGYVYLNRFSDAASFLLAARVATAGGAKTTPFVPLATWLRAFPAALKDMKIQRRLTGRY